MRPISSAAEYSARKPSSVRNPCRRPIKDCETTSKTEPVAISMNRAKSVWDIRELPSRGLIVFAGMRACGRVEVKRVDTHQLGEFQEIGNASRAFQGLVEVITVPRHSSVVAELCSQFGNFCARFTQSLFMTGHSAFVPEKQAKLSMERID